MSSSHSNSSHANPLQPQTSSFVEIGDPNVSSSSIQLMDPPTLIFHDGLESSNLKEESDAVSNRENAHPSFVNNLISKIHPGVGFVGLCAGALLLNVAMISLFKSAMINELFPLKMDSAERALSFLSAHHIIIEFFGCSALLICPLLALSIFKSRKQKPMVDVKPKKKFGFWSVASPIVFFSSLFIFLGVLYPQVKNDREDMRRLAQTFMSAQHLSDVGINPSGSLMESLRQLPHHDNMSTSQRLEIIREWAADNQEVLQRFAEAQASVVRQDEIETVLSLQQHGVSHPDFEMVLSHGMISSGLREQLPHLYRRTLLSVNNTVNSTQNEPVMLRSQP